MVTPDAADGDVRQAILDAAVEVIEDRGLADVSMREVARRAGVSHQLPYHYFADREGILAAIAQGGFDILGERLGAVQRDDVTGIEKLVHAGRAYVDFACERPAHFRVMFRQDFVALERHPSARQDADECFGKIPPIVRQMIREGLAPHPDEEAIVLLAWSIAHGLACLFLDGPLATKLPEAAAAREATTERVMSAMRFLVEGASTRRRKE